MYHDNRPFENLENKMVNLLKIGKKVIRVDEYQKKNKFTTFTYGDESQESAAFLMLVWDNKWKLHIQPTVQKHPGTKDAKPDKYYHLKGNQIIY